MYDLVDRPVASLGTFEHELLGAMRRWVHAVITVGGASPAGHAPLDRAMRAIDAGSADDLLIQLPCHSTVGESEAVLLGLWRLVRERRDELARAVAALLVDERHAAPLLAAMERHVRA